MTIPHKTLLKRERELTNSPLMLSVKNSICTRSNTVVEAVTVGAACNPENVRRVESIVSSSEWDYLFPRRAPEYTYLNFLKATAKFPAFCGTYTDGRNSEAVCRKSLAVMFAHFAQETGGHTAHWPSLNGARPLSGCARWAGMRLCVTATTASAIRRSGRGKPGPAANSPTAISRAISVAAPSSSATNYNYGPFSLAMFGTVRTLLDRPEMVADTWLNLASAIFFFVYPQPPKPSMLHVIDGTWKPNARDRAGKLTPGFGVTTQIINGGVECGGSRENEKSQNRIAYYRGFTGRLNVPILAGEVLGCKGMQQFHAEGSAAMKIYWEEDWSWRPDTPGGKSYACKLVGYQNPVFGLYARRLCQMRPGEI